VKQKHENDGIVNIRISKVSSLHPLQHSRYQDDFCFGPDTLPQFSWSTKT